MGTGSVVMGGTEGWIDQTYKDEFIWGNGDFEVMNK